jgi:hypothetical protein
LSASWNFREKPDMFIPERIAGMIGKPLSIQAQDKGRTLKCTKEDRHPLVMPKVGSSFVATPGKV